MRGEIRTIVVGVATSHRQDPVLRPAAELAAALGARLVVVHAFVPQEPVVAVYAHPRYGLRSWAAQEREILAALEAQADRLGMRGRIRCRAVAASPAEALARVVEEEHADLVVSGSTRRGPLARTLLGTTCGHVLRVARVPVLMLRAPRAGEAVPARVLLTTDLSSLSAEVHERGVEVARALAGGAAPEFRSLFVAGDVPPPPPQLAHLPREVGSAECARFLAERRERPQRLEARVRLGDPAREIVAEAEEWEAGLIVVGTHARRGAKRLILGSVAEAVVRDAGCSVLVIPSPAIELLNEGEVEAQLIGAAS